MTTEILEDARKRMQGAVDALDRDLAGYRTNRASPALIENLVVDYGYVASTAVGQRPSFL